MGSERFGWLGWNHPRAQGAAGALGMDREHSWALLGHWGFWKTLTHGPIPLAIVVALLMSGTEQVNPCPHQETPERFGNWEQP